MRSPGGGPPGRPGCRVSRRAPVRLRRGAATGSGSPGDSPSTRRRIGSDSPPSPPGPRHDPEPIPAPSVVDGGRSRGDRLRSRGRAGGDGHLLEADPQVGPIDAAMDPELLGDPERIAGSGWRSRNRYPARRAGRPRRRPPRPRRRRRIGRGRGSRARRRRPGAAPSSGADDGRAPVPGIASPPRIRPSQSPRTSTTAAPLSPG